MLEFVVGHIIYHHDAYYPYIVHAVYVKPHFFPAESSNSDTAFRQQRMAAIQPIVTPAWVVGLFMAVGVLFVPLGTWLKLKYADVVELMQQYDGPGMIAEGCSISAANEGKEVQ